MPINRIIKDEKSVSHNDICTVEAAISALQAMVDQGFGDLPLVVQILGLNATIVPVIAVNRLVPTDENGEHMDTMCIAIVIDPDDAEEI